MSYCRFGEADAYIYDDINHGIICCVCILMPLDDYESPLFGGGIRMNTNFVAGYDYDKMIAHIADHRANGDYIPEDVDERLVEERDCEHIFAEGRYGVRCEKCWRPQNI